MSAARPRDCYCAVSWHKPHNGPEAGRSIAEGETSTTAGIRQSPSSLDDTRERAGSGSAIPRRTVEKGCHRLPDPALPTTALGMEIRPMAERLSTARLTLRSWRVRDAPAALAVYGHASVARWLSPAMDRVPDLQAMRLLLQQWVAEDERMYPPAGRWAIELREGPVIGGAILLPLPPGLHDLEIGWQLNPDMWGHGYATEATYALAQWAFGQGVHEIFAVVRPANARAAATVRRNGMQWVGETDKYFGLTLQVFRLRPADLDAKAASTSMPPETGSAS